MIKDELQDDGGLLSLEKLDRASPDLWPEKSKCDTSIFTKIRNINK